LGLAPRTRRISGPSGACSSSLPFALRFWFDSSTARPYSVESRSMASSRGGRRSYQTLCMNVRRKATRYMPCKRNGRSFDQCRRTATVSYKLRQGAHQITARPLSSSESDGSIGFWGTVHAASYLFMVDCRGLCRAKADLGHRGRRRHRLMDKRGPSHFNGPDCPCEDFKWRFRQPVDPTH
jgi:hypothetical protein